MATRPAAALAACAILLTAGCARNKQPVETTTEAYVNIDRLVRMNPAWKSVVFIDRASGVVTSQAKASAGRAPAGIKYEIPAVTYPALRGSVTGIASEQARLEQIAALQVDEMSGRLATARRRQVNREAQAWQAAADARLLVARQSVESDYVSSVQGAMGATHVEWLNLYMQVNALKRIVQNWALTVPPSPKLAQARQELEVKQAALEKIESSRKSIVAELAAKRDRSLAQAEADSEREVSDKRIARQEELAVHDRVLISSEKRRLWAQLHELIADIRGMGDVDGPQQRSPKVVLPPSPPPAGMEDLRVAKADLEIQKKRWITFLYRDTLDSAQDVAAARHWKLILTPSHTAPNRTAEVANVLSATLWRT